MAALVLARAKLDEAESLEEALRALTAAELAAALADPLGLALILELHAAPARPVSVP